MPIEWDTKKKSLKILEKFKNVLKRGCPPTSWSQSQNIIDKFLSLKREEEAWMYKTVLASFEFCFVFKIWHWKFCVYKIEHFFLRWKGSEKMGRTPKFKNPGTVLETRCWWTIMLGLGTFKLSVYWDQFLRRNEEQSWRNGQFLCNFVQKTIATMQLCGIFYQIYDCFGHTAFAWKSVWKWTLWKDQRVIFVKNAILALQSCLTWEARAVWQCLQQ